jgi:hypothetical protein
MLDFPGTSRPSSEKIRALPKFGDAYLFLANGRERSEDVMTEKCPQLSVPIDPETKRRLEAAAAREDRPVASYVRRIVLKALDGEREGATA